MDNTIFLQFIILVIVLTLSFYLIYPLLKGSNSVNNSEKRGLLETIKDRLHRDPNPDSPEKDKEKEVESEDESEEESDENSNNMVDYQSEANSISEDKQRVDNIVEKENEDFRGLHPNPSYEDDPTTIDLQELKELKEAIRAMTKELTSVKRSNADLQRMVMKLQQGHEDALARVSNTDLWSMEAKKWNRGFAQAFRDYEAQILEDKASKSSNATAKAR